MIRRLLVCLFPAVALSMVARSAPAQLVNEEAVGRLMIGPGVGLLLPSMSDVNSNIDVVNPFLTGDEIRSMDRINEALVTQLQIRYKLGQTPKEDPDDKRSFLDRFSVGFAWGAVNTESSISDITRVNVSFSARSTTYYPNLYYHLPWVEKSLPRMQIYLGGGPLFLQSGSIYWQLIDNTNNNFITTGDISELAGSARATGSGVGWILQTGGSYMLNNRFSFALDIGYRSAKIDNIQLNQAVGQDKRFPGDDTPGGNPQIRRPGDWAVIDFFLRNPEGSWDGRDRPDPSDVGGCDGCPLYYTGGDLEVDYSGLFTTVSLFVHF